MILYSIIVLECGLRITGKYESFFEEKSGKYLSLYNFRPQNSIHKRSQNDIVRFKSIDEFDYTFKTNNLGYSDIDWDIDNNEKKFRILVLGDSFTEGMGAPQDSSWVAQIRRRYENDDIIWMNAGISASDPFSNYHSLVNELDSFKVDLVIQLYSNQDFDEDILIRSTYDRYSQGKLVYDTPPKMELVYAYSHIYRMYYHLRYDTYNYISPRDLENNHPRESFKQLDSLYNQWTTKNHTPAILLFYYTNAYYYMIDSNTHLIDLPNSRIGENLFIRNIKACYQEMLQLDRKKFTSFWWKNDGHHNSQGYEMMAKCIDESIRPIVDSLYNKKMRSAL